MGIIFIDLTFLCIFVPNSFILGRNINDIYNFLLYISKKERGAFLTVDQAMSAIDNAQMELFNFLFKDFRANQVLNDGLIEFKVQKQFTSNSSGEVAFESNYLYLLQGVFTITGSTINPVRFLSTYELPDALTSQLRPVALSSPIALEVANGFQLYPQSTQTGFYTYLKRPTTPVLAYTTSGRTLTYDPNGSTQLDFSDAYVNNIISRSLKFIGINMSEQDIEQFAQIQSQQTPL